VSMWAKLTQKVDHFTVFKSFPSTSCSSQKFPPNNLEKIGWLNVRGSIWDVFIGWGWGMDWWEKVTVQNCGRALVKPKNQPGRVVLAPYWLKWSTIYSVDVGAAKRSNTDICQCLEPPFEPFTSPWIHPCYNQPQVSKPKFRLETNSTVVWLYAGGVSLILPDVRFGTVSGHI